MPAPQIAPVPRPNAPEASSLPKSPVLSTTNAIGHAIQSALPSECILTSTDTPNTYGLRSKSLGPIGNIQVVNSQIYLVRADDKKELIGKLNPLSSEVTFTSIDTLLERVSREKIIAMPLAYAEDLAKTLIMFKVQPTREKDGSVEVLFTNELGGKVTLKLSPNIERKRFNITIEQPSDLPDEVKGPKASDTITSDMPGAFGMAKICNDILQYRGLPLERREQFLNDPTGEGLKRWIDTGNADTLVKPEDRPLDKTPDKFAVSLWAVAATFEANGISSKITGHSSRPDLMLLDPYSGREIGAFDFNMAGEYGSPIYQSTIIPQGFATYDGNQGFKDFEFGVNLEPGLTDKISGIKEAVEELSKNNAKFLFAVVLRDLLFDTQKLDDPGILDNPAFNRERIELEKKYPIKANGKNYSLVFSPNGDMTLTDDQTPTNTIVTNIHKFEWREEAGADFLGKMEKFFNLTLAFPATP